MTYQDTLTGIYQLARVRPLVAWAGGGILLGIAVAIHTVGITQIDWSLTLIAVLIPLLLQYLAHPLNDLADFDVDLRAPIKATGRKKVLVSGLMTHKSVKIVSLAILVITIYMAMLLMVDRPLSIIFMAVGLYAVLGYNTFKLGWKPFSELTIVIPTLITLVMAVSYVACGEITQLSILIGMLHAIVGIQFFMTSRAMDTEADRKMGKITTLVKYPDPAILSIYNLGSIGIILIVGILCCGIETLCCMIGLIALSLCIYVQPLLKVKYDDNLSRILYGDPTEISRARKIQIYITIVNAVMISVALVLT